MKLTGVLGWSFAALISTALLWAQSSPSSAEPKAAVDGDPLITHWVVPEYPPELKAKQLQGEVAVQMVIDETGKLGNPRVTKATDPRFGESVVKALEACVFTPALQDGKPVAAAVELDWTFRLPYHPAKEQPPFGALHGLPKKPATPDSTPDPDYPATLIERHLDGEVLFNLEISTAGEVFDLKILEATHPDFVIPAVAAIKRWKFHPAKRGDLAEKDIKRAPLSFFYEGRLAEDQRTPLEANGIALEVPEGKTAKEICSREPEIISIADPVFPLELLAAGQPGEAEVAFTVNPQGFPEDVVVKTASTSACGSALAAAVEATQFKPALLNGQTVAVKLIRKQRFLLPPEVAGENELPEIRLLRQVRAGQKTPGPRGLESPLAPLWRAVPKYPSTLRAEQLQGSAVIEVIIDKTGRARVPKIVSATRDEFGWAAATAVAQWVFVPPVRAGETVDVRVQIPVQFSDK